MSSFRKTSVLAVIAALGAFSTFTSAAEGATPSAAARSVAVSYGHLDLSDTRAINALYRQLASAAERACGSYDGRDLRERSDWRRCRDEAVSEAISRLVEMRIAALNHQRNSRATAPAG
jgi:UrcA family protein